MKISQRVGVLLVTVLGCASTEPPCAAPTAPADSPKFEVGPGPYNVDLNAGLGSYEERFIRVPDGAFTLKGLIQFITVSKDRKWAPLAAIELMGPRESYNVGLEAFVLPNEPGKLQFAVRDGLHDFWDASFARADFTNSPFPFELQLLGSGEVQVSVGGKVGRIVSARGFEITRVRVLASTAHIQFSNLNITSVDAVTKDHGAQHVELPYADEPVNASDPFQLPKLPPMDFPRNVDWYPDRARASGLEGRALVAFDITTAGSVQGVSMLWSEDALLASSATQMLSKAHFKVPVDWQNSGASRRWRLGFVYCLPPSGQSEKFGVPVETVLITGSRLPGTPQRHPPDPDSTSRCNKQPR